MTTLEPFITKKYKVCEDVLLRACRFYSGVHRLAPIRGVQGDFGWWDILVYLLIHEKWPIGIKRGDYMGYPS